jgi:2TM domain
MSDEGERRKAAIDRLRNKRAFGQDLVAYVVVNAFLVLVWALSGRGYFWPAWVMGAWGVGIVMHGWTAFVQRPITEDEIEREMKHRGDSVT